MINYKTPIDEYNFLLHEFLKISQQNMNSFSELNEGFTSEIFEMAGKLASMVLDYITPFVKEGVTTLKLDTLCHDFIICKGAIPAPLNYKGFPKSICTSVNHVVCHGIPGNKVLNSGDIIINDKNVNNEVFYQSSKPPF